MDLEPRGKGDADGRALRGDDGHDPEGLLTYDFLSEGIPRGDPITEADFGGATCTSTGCTCNAGATSRAGNVGRTLDDGCGFGDQLLVARMQDYHPEIKAENVVVEYGYSGLGYSGDPYGADVDPLVTVRLTE